MPSRIVVIGPPCSGKSTWVREHAAPDDIVIDFDDIANRIAGTVGNWDHEPWVREQAARKWHLGVISALKSKRNAWIIHANPKPSDLARYQAAGAYIHTIDPGEDVVRARAAVERPASSVPAIDRWYGSAQPSAPRMADPRSSRRYRTAALAYLDAHRREAVACALCGGQVDMAAPSTSDPGPSVEHTVPVRWIVANAPDYETAVDWACDVTRWAIAHRLCQNRQGGQATARVSTQRERHWASGKGVSEATRSRDW